MDSSVKDSSVRIWQTRVGAELIQPRRYRASSIAWSRDSLRLAVVDESGVVVLDSKTGQELIKLVDKQKGGDAAKSEVVDVSWSPDGNRIANCAVNDTCTIWAAGSGRQLLVLRGNAAPILSAAWSPDGTKLATGARNGTATIWDHSGKTLRILRLDGAVRSVAWSPDRRHLAVAGYYNSVAIWDVNSGGQVTKFPTSAILPGSFGPTCPATDVASPPGK